MTQSFQNVRGTHDFTPGESRLFSSLNSRARQTFALYGYEEIILPILEEEAVFKKGVGETSDIVERQMFKIARRAESGDEEQIVLRPEGTAQVARYFIQNSLHKQGDFYKFFYMGAMFRGERPQKGRLRQFNHIGAEALGSRSPWLDAEVVALADSLITDFGIKEKELKINNLGCKADKERFAVLLQERLEALRSGLCVDCQRRLDKNPLRVIDCKNSQCKKIVESLKLGDQHICPDCKSHFAQVLTALDQSEVKYAVVPTLVRGLDYYTNTVFEFTSSSLGSQDACGAGGRYDGLLASLGGSPIPAIGFALGVERLMLALGEAQEEPLLDVYVTAVSAELIAQAVKITDHLRREGVRADTDYCGKSLKAQLRQAERKAARFSIVIGPDELKENSVMVKDMKEGKQEKVKIEELILKIKERN